ncbi:MAG TPA: hypothetical protein VJ721_01265 [Chthoniobacterales bacterium]|nr:hypothetical protein [Chthoniobacterales bacterium]
MKFVIQIIVAIGLAPFAFAQSPSPAASGAPAAPSRTDLYHVHFANAAVGKAKELGEELKKPSPDASAPAHLTVLRHADGDSWDYCVITHLGTKATIEANRPAPASSLMGLYAAHTDTFASGPAWNDFAKQLGLDDASKSKASAFVVSIYRPAAGQREALDKFLNEPPDRTSDSSSGRVTLQHLEGAAWTFLTVQRWNSWADYGKDNVTSIAQMGRNQQGGWFQLRNLISFHTDTLCDRIAP